MARIYANENFPLSTVEELRRLGHDVLTTFESGRAGKGSPTRKCCRSRSPTIVLC